MQSPVVMQGPYQQQNLQEQKQPVQMQFSPPGNNLLMCGTCYQMVQPEYQVVSKFSNYLVYV
jgi:hypothetical protein